TEAPLPRVRCSREGGGVDQMGQIKLLPIMTGRITVVLRIQARNNGKVRSASGPSCRDRLNEELTEKIADPRLRHALASRQHMGGEHGLYLLHRSRRRSRRTRASQRKPLYRRYREREAACSNRNRAWRGGKARTRGNPAGRHR